MTNLYSSISFSNVASRYNEINAIPAAAQAELGTALRELAPAGSVMLDIGCGAGRIALPAVSAGLPVIGIDINGAMVHEAQSRAEERPFGGVNGDITTLPFPDNSFTHIFTANVFHLLPTWQTAIAEAIRVLRPGGLFIQGYDWLDPESIANQFRWELRKVVMGLEPGLRPTMAASPKVVAEALAEAGGTTAEAVVACSWETPTSPAEILEQMATRQYNETWMLSDELLDAAVVRLEEWMHGTWDDVDMAYPVERRFTLGVTRGLK